MERLSGYLTAEGAAPASIEYEVHSRDTEGRPTRGRIWGVPSSAVGANKHELRSADGAEFEVILTGGNPTQGMNFRAEGARMHPSSQERR